MKKIQIEQDLFVQMVKYFFSDELGFDDDDVCEFYHDIKKGIDKKLDAVSKRSYYTQYKTADTQEEREKARLKYLDAVGMHEDFRFWFHPNYINGNVPHFRQGY